MTTALAAAVRAATGTDGASAAALDLRGTSVAVVRMFGSMAGVAYLQDPDETRRRSCDGCRGGMPSLALLDLLMNLPVGQAVACNELTAGQRKMLRAAPSGAVEFDHERVIRRAVAPVSARLALVAAKDWKVGLERAGRFAPFCARAVLLSSMPADQDDLVMSASFYGTGVCVFVKGKLAMLVEPQPYLRRRHTPAQWRFAEELYAQVTAP